MTKHKNMGKTLYVFVHIFYRDIIQKMLSIVENLCIYRTKNSNNHLK